jgi:RNA polymerase sigma-70 factor (subfamily 1)
MKDINVTIQLVKKVQEGDKEALEKLCERYLGRIHRLARQRLGPKLRRRMDSMDVSQDVIIRVLASIDNFEIKTDASFLSWVSKLVENTVRDQADHVKAAKRDIDKEYIPNNLSETQDDPMINLLAIDPKISQQLQLKDDVIRLESTMDSLKEEQREVILLRNYTEMSFKEMGAQLDCSEDAARMKYVRAMDALTDAMK